MLIYDAETERCLDFLISSKVIFRKNVCDGVNIYTNLTILWYRGLSRGRKRDGWAWGTEIDTSSGKKFY